MEPLLTRLFVEPDRFPSNRFFQRLTESVNVFIRSFRDDKSISNSECGGNELIYIHSQAFTHK